MTDWFARPCLTVVTDVAEASLRFYVDRLGFTSPWRYDEDGKSIRRTGRSAGCARLSWPKMWPEKNWQAMIFISLNVEPETPEAAIAALDALVSVELEARALRSRKVRGATGFWWSMNLTQQSALLQLSELKLHPSLVHPSLVKDRKCGIARRCHRRAELCY